ncbi:MAG: Uma2 family endonuclease [Leptolyngbyaceae cyanobacterium]
MNITTKVPIHVTFEQYVSGGFECSWSDYVWVDGELLEVALESGKNNRIARLLAFKFELYSQARNLGLGVCHKDTDIEVDSVKHRTRKPDVMVCSRELTTLLDDRSAVILKSMVPPIIIVEVISKNYRNVDLVEKLQEYRDRSVPEYWTIEWDTPEPQIVVRNLDLQTGQYVERIYSPGDVVRSQVLPELTLTVDEILLGL